MLKTHKENSNIITTNHYEREEGMGFGEKAARRQWLETRKKGFEYLVEQINNRYGKYQRITYRTKFTTKRTIGTAQQDCNSSNEIFNRK